MAAAPLIEIVDAPPHIFEIRRSESDERMASPPDSDASMGELTPEEVSSEQEDSEGSPSATAHLIRLKIDERIRIGEPLRDFIHVTRYARFVDWKGRRETWSETVRRTMDYLCRDVSLSVLSREDRAELELAILDCEVMPSMRVLMTAGEALDVDNMCGYNCSYVAVDSLDAFHEILYVLMCGSGAGFSCEKRYVDKLPPVPASIEDGPEADREDENEQERDPLPPGTMKAEDSRKGWVICLRDYIRSLFYMGYRPRVSLRDVRKEGARLKTMGGRASGPKPLRELLKKLHAVLMGARGRKLTSLEVHNIVCHIARVVVVGGVRRSALISLSDLSDEGMRDAKSGNWWDESPHLAMSNNSAVYEGRPSDSSKFWEEWKALEESGSGERGIFNRSAARIQAEKSGRRTSDGGRIEFGVNPCSEVILRSRQTCNLTEVVIRRTDDMRSLERKVRLASILGTLQSRLTKFDEDVLSPEWKRNCEEERLLGVSFTGIMDNPIMHGAYKSTGMRDRLRSLEKKYRSAVASHQKEIQEATDKIMQELTEMIKPFTPSDFAQFMRRTNGEPDPRDPTCFIKSTDPAGETETFRVDISSGTDRSAKSKKAFDEMNSRVHEMFDRSLAKEMGAEASSPRSADVMREIKSLRKRIAESDRKELGSLEFKSRLARLRSVAVESNRTLASKLGIEASKAVTCIKPSGTVSLLVDSASGIHTRWDEHYVRRVRLDRKDPVLKFLEREAPHMTIEADSYSPEQMVVSFPVRAPPEAIVRNEWNAVKQLELWKAFHDHWCEHKPSVTIYVKPDEWKTVGEWVWRNFDSVSGIAFLPYDNGTYTQAPHETISESEYERLAETIRKAGPLDWNLLSKYESKEEGDVRRAGSGNQFACTGEKCEL